MRGHAHPLEVSRERRTTRLPIRHAQIPAVGALALVAYWGLQFGVAAWTGDVTSLFTQGILIKIMFTAALIRGLKSANRAVMLQSELERVFG